jgi:outer membrane protein TolC
MPSSPERPSISRAAIPFLLLLGVCAFPVSPALSRAQDIPVTVDEAVRMAVENNLELKVQTFNPAIAETGVHGARGIYDTAFTAVVEFLGQKGQTVPGSNLTIDQRNYNVNASIQQLVPTGGTASAVLSNAWYEDNLGASFSRYAQPRFSIAFSQPVLKGLGREVTEQGITLAEDSAKASIADWRQKAEDTAAAANTRFYVLYNARENLETRKASLAVARRIHEENQARVKAGVLASFQLLDSELGVLSREADLLESERAVKDAADALRVFLQHPAQGMLVPTGQIVTVKVSRTPEDAIAAALRNRPELEKSRVALRTAEFSEKVSRNFVLPSLALTGSAGVAGLDRSFGEAVGDLSAGKYPEWAVGLNFSYPIGNSSAEAEHAANRLRTAQSLAVLRSVEEAIGLEVRNALRALETRYLQIEVARKGVTVAEVRFDSYDKRQKLGLATTKDLLDSESQLVAAKEILSGALAAFQVALAELYRSMGELLDRHKLRIDDDSIAPKAWKELR